MSRAMKPDPNCPLISQSLVKSGAIHHLTAKYLFNVTLLARKIKKIPFFPDTNSESFKIANELVLKYFQRFNLKYTSDSFQLELNLSSSNSSLPIKRLKLTYSRDPLKNFLKIVEKSPKLRFHDTLVIQELLLKVPTLLDDNTKSHFISILKKAGNFNNADDNAIFNLIQKNSKINKGEADIKKISHSEPPKQPTNLSNSPTNTNINENNTNNHQGNNAPNTSLKTRQSDMTDLNRRSKSRDSTKSQQSTSSCSFFSTSSKEDSKSTRKSLTETDSQAVVAQITKEDQNAYSCNLIDNESGSDSISEANKMKQMAGKNKNNNNNNSNQNTSRRPNKNKGEDSNVSGYANSTSSYFYEYETISEPEQDPNEKEAQNLGQPQVGRLQKSDTNIVSRSAKAEKTKQKRQSSQQVPSSEKLQKSSILSKIESREKMSLADQITSFDLKSKNSPAQTQPEPSPRFYRLPVPEGYEVKPTKKKSSKRKQSKNATSTTNTNQNLKNPKEVMAQINKLKKELEALKSDDDSDSYSSDHDDMKTSQLQKALSNAVKESSSAIKRNRNVSSSSDDDDYNNKNKQKVPSKTSFGTTLLEQKKIAKPIQHHHSRSNQRDNDGAYTITTDSKTRQTNDKEQGKSIVVLKSVDNPNRLRTISEQRQIDKMNNNNNKTNETQSIIDNQPETYRLTIPPDPFKIDKKLTKEATRQSQNQKQSSRLNQNSKYNQSQSQRPNQTQKIMPKPNQNQSQSQRPINQKIQQQKTQNSKPSNASSSDESISDSPPPAMKQLWESKNKDKNNNKNNNNSTKTTNTNNNTNTNKDKNKNDELLKVSNQNSSSSLYDAFVEGEKKEKSQQNHSQNKAKPQTQEQPKKTETNNKPQQQQQQKVENTKPTISFKQPMKELTKASTANAAVLSDAIKSSKSKYTNHSKTSSSMSTSKYTNHAKTATIDPTTTKPTDTSTSNAKYTSHSKTVSVADNLDQGSTISTSSKNKEQPKETALSMRTIQPKSRLENHSVEPKKLGMSQRFINFNKNVELSSSSQSESFRIPLTKTRILRARMLSDLSDADFDSSSSISERRRLPPLKVEIPFHDGHAKAFKNYYDFLSSSENFDLDKENGQIKKRIKEKLLKRSSSVNPSSMLPKRSSTSTATTKEADNTFIKKASTSGQLSHLKDNQNDAAVSTGGENLKSRKERLNNGNVLKVDIQPVKDKIEATNNNNNANRSNRSNSENSKQTTTSTTAPSNTGDNTVFNAQITLVESEKLSRVDTYFVMYIDGSNQAQRTKTVKGKTSSKEFREDFSFNITREKCNLVIQAKKEDLINGDQIISSARLSLITLPLHKRFDKWVPLTTFGRVRLVMTLEKGSSNASKNSTQNKPQAAMKAVTGSSNKDTDTFQLAKDDPKNKNPLNPDLNALLKISDERKKDDPLLNSLVKSMSQTKTLNIDEPTVNVPLLSESSSSESENKKDDKNGAKKKRSKSRSKSRNKNRKTKK